MTICPNINSKEWKEQSSVLGEDLAYKAWDMNDGQPVWLNPDGTENQLFSDLSQYYRRQKRMGMLKGSAREEAIRSAGKRFFDSYRAKYTGSQESYNVLNEVALQPEQDKTQYSKVLSNTKSSDIIDVVIERVKAIFPNIQYELIDSDHKLAQGRKAFIMNGTVYLNRDKINLQDPLHEVGHIFLHVVKNTNFELYNRLISEARGYYDTNSPIAQFVKKNYGDRSTEEQLNDIVAIMVGINSPNHMYFSYSIPREDSVTLYENNKSVIAQFWDYVKGLILRAFGIKDSGLNVDINIQNFSINDLAMLIADASMEQKALSNITTDELKVLLAGTVEESRVDDKSVDHLMQIHDILMGDVKYTPELMENINIDAIRNEIKINGGVLPDWRLGRPVTFEGDLNSEANTKRIKNILTEQKERSKKMKDEWLEWVNKGADINESFETRKSKDNVIYPAYSAETLSKIKHIIEYSSYTKFFKYSDLKTVKSLKHLYDSKFEGYDPVIAVEVDEQGELVVSIFDITNDFLGREGFSKKGNILSKLLPVKIRESIPFTTRLTLGNTEGDIRKIMLQTLSNKIQKNKGVRVNNVGIVRILPRVAEYTPVDQFLVNDNITTMGKIKEFNELLTDELRIYFQEDYTKYSSLDPWRSLAQFYKERRWKGYGLDKLYVEKTDEPITNEEKVNILKRRLLFLEGNLLREDDLKIPRGENDDRQIEIMKEISLITDAIIQYEGISDFVSKKMNPKEKISTLQMWLHDTYGMGDETVQGLRTFFLNKSNQVTREYNNTMKPLKADDGAFAYFFNRSKLKYVSRTQNVAERIFDEIIVKERDSKNNEYKTGFIYWTNDPKEDPINGQKAKDLDISDETLAKGRQIIEIITDQLVKTTVHNRVIGLGALPEGTKEDWYNQAKLDIFASGGYKQGMIPLIKRTSAANLSASEVFGSMRKKVSRFGDIFSLYDNMSDKEIAESENLNRMSDLFYNQFAFKVPEGITKYGHKSRLINYLGIEPEYASDEKESSVNFKLVDKQMNDDFSTDLELIMNYFVMTEVRTRVYEKDVLPVVNAVRIVAYSRQQYKGEDNEGLQKYIKFYVDQAIHGKRQKFDLNIAGMDMDRFITTGLEISNFIVLPFNFNVGMISLITNSIYAYTEGIVSNITQAMGIDTPMFTAAGLLKATGLQFSHFHMTSQMAFDYQLINSDDYEIINMPIKRYQRTKKSLFSRHYMNWMNWATDMYARTLIMTAQMIHDGTWEAHSYDEKTGEVIFDPKKDKRFGWDGKKFSEEGQVLYDFTKQRNIQAGIQSADQELTRAYTDEESRKFKTFANKYVVGAYGNKEKSLLNHFLIAKVFTNLRNWTITRITNAFEKKKSIPEGGRYVVVKDENGLLVAKWERLFVEGYINTVIRSIGLVVKAQSFSVLKNLLPHEKRNLAKASVNVAMYVSLLLMYNLIVKTDMDDDEEAGFVPEWRIIKNFKYSLDSIFAIFIIHDMVTKPFAMVDILGNMLREFVNLFTKGKLNNYPFRTQLGTGWELFGGNMDDLKLDFNE